MGIRFTFKAASTFVLWTVFHIQGLHATRYKFGPCPSTCDTNLALVFKTCATLRSKGCVATRCKFPNVGYTCDFSTSISRKYSLSPGDQLNLRRAQWNREIQLFFQISPTTPATDIYFLIDGTVSMKTFMPRINRVLIGIVRDLSDTRLIRFGVGVYRDESELNNGFAQRQEITRNAVDVQNAIRLLRATGGEDVEEALLIALYKVANAKSTGWRDDSHRLVVLFGDSPGHEPTCFSGRTLRRGVVARKLFSKGIKVVAVSLGAGLDKRTKKRSGCEGEDGRKGQARDITRKTGGTVIAELNSASIRSAIVQTLNFPPRKIHVKTRGCKDVASVSFAERFPVDVASIFPLYGKMTIKMRADMCSRRKSICPITFFDNGAVRSAIRVGCFEPNGCKKG